MRFLRVCLLVACMIPGFALAQKREYVELQRSIADLQDQLRTWQQSQSEYNGRMSALLQQALDSINKVSTSVALLDAAIRERDKNVTGPIASVGAKVDSMASEFQAMRVSLDDLSSRLGKLQQGLIDLGNTVKVISAPPQPPAMTPGAPGSAGAAAGGPPAGATAEALYANAMRDKDSGAYDVALQEFSDYLKYYGSSEMAPNAQYYMGEIYYNRKAYDNALDAFDAVLERYPDNNKTLDAMYMKGRTLFQAGERTKAAEEFRAVYNKSPRSEIGAKAKAQLANMGLTVNPTARRATKKK
jgi:tol-pal system protein YbgF